MDRYNDVKVLLKNWEQGFVKEHKRKPNKEDIDRAPEETRNLYKEYRSLKQAKENSNEAANGHTHNQKESDCWGSHLNRSALPTSSPKLTSQDRDSLKASSQYYGLKLKNNLSSISKERPVSLKKMHRPGRLPLDSLKDEQTIRTKSVTSPAATAKTTTTDSEFSPFSPRMNPCLGSLASKTLQPAEPEEPFQPFETFRQDNDEAADAAGSCSISKDISSQSTTSALSPSPIRSSTLLSSLSPERNLGASKVGARTVGSETKGILGDVKENAETSKTQNRGTDSAGGESVIGFNGSPQICGGLRGGRGLGARPSPASRLSLVDRKWLERCQVFGEMGAEEKPGAGNQEMNVEQRGMAEKGEKLKGEMQGVNREAKEEMDIERERQESLEMGRGKKSESVTGDKIVTTSATNSEKSRKEGVGKEKRKGQEEMERGQTSHITADDDNESSPKTKASKNRRKKRQREVVETQGNTTEEGGVKKRRRGGRKKEESSDVSPSSAHGGAGKKKRSKRKEGDGEGEGEEETKGPKKMPQENLFGDIEEEFGVNKIYRAQSARARVAKGAEGNFVKINLKKKSHVKGYALRGIALRRQLYMQKFQLKGERFGGGGGYFGRGRWGGFRGGFRGGLSRQGDTCYKCGGTGHWAIDCKGREREKSSLQSSSDALQFVFYLKDDGVALLESKNKVSELEISITGLLKVLICFAAPPPPVADDKAVEEEPFELPTLEEVARATGTLQPQPQVAASTFKEEQNDQEKEVDSKRKDEVLLNVIRPDYERPPPPPPMEPLYELTEDGKVQETPEDVYSALRDLGYQSFRPGQEEAIMRILSGLSTLVVLSTGMGKSLCYQLPAYLYAQRSKCITLVISPLVSLMDDQLSGLPAKLKAACIHSNMTMKQREAAIEKVKSGQVCLLLLSPEALVGGGGSGSGCLPSAQELPPVAFACIDEAHCVSEWSHNFRPCYLRLCKVLRERLGVRCLLGLTATATLSTALDIAKHLEISDQAGIAVRSAAVPPNLNLSVSTDREKDQALVSLLKGDRFGCLDLIIVYCTRREETVRVAALLRTCLQGVLLKENKKSSSSSRSENNPVGQRKKELARKKIRKPLKWQAESYHAGLSGSERRRVQNNFMCGELRIVVATVAFGMGLDKSDVRGIIHYNMPKSFESYVQEIGRAGRDGEPAHCHLFLDPEGGDLHELRRHIYADTVDYYTVKRLVQKVFPACKCKQIHQKQQELFKDVEDSELLEVMDVCDQESSMNSSAQQDMSDKDESQPAAAPESDLSSAGLAIREDNDKREGRNEDEMKKQTEDQRDNRERDQEEERCDWPRERVCHTHERAIPIQETIEALDITEEGVETLLCYLELHPQRFVELLHPTLSVCKVSCYDGPRQLQKITKICPPIAVVLARRRMAGERVEQCDQLEFDVVEVADTMGWQLPLVKRGLRQLQWSTDRAGGRSGVLVEFSSPSFYFRSYGDLSDEEMDRVCQFLHKRVQDQERTQLYQLTACFKAFKSVAFCSVLSCVDDLDESRSLQLKSLLSEYFDKRRDGDHALKPFDLEELDKYKLLDWEDQIRADIRSFLSNRSDEKFSGRAVARIFHGIGSPCYPAQTYGKDRRYWRKYIQFDFNQLIRLATQEIIRFK
ncbi:ATP-dependent DNA helicase Q4 [Pundamilia nyererei]|uniref:ATP-dependent DNA helicase Q4 n=1 Tax=Pundamilia nyererei TaxID=303518 RepID=A0A9Y6JIM3_9CICH|nr:PREDICTED: ATP-dependent DNA helicase Q4 [Pundamilia nyererei]